MATNILPDLSLNNLEHVLLLLVLLLLCVSSITYIIASCILFVISHAPMVAMVIVGIVVLSSKRKRGIA